MSVDAMMLGLYTIPEIKLNIGTDWLGLSGVVLTAVIVAIGAWTTIRNFKVTTDSQEKIAEKNALMHSDHSKAENVARNRQEWINSLRIAIAGFISACHQVRALSKLSNRKLQIGPVTFEDGLAAEKQHVEAQAQLILAQGEARKYLALIELYINPGEAESRNLVKGAQEILHQATDDSFLLTWECDTLIEISQPVLKTEWERVKRMI
ncbi:hypothetical protein [Pseudomonas plecoglossicida]|uniref:hypothetical protein n=1 Tax=Pseudomonas plecoglossicida TaxID=70775 RepID=UPI0015E44C6D|nr:hypothetical protein [Pseudomonas plecoglossicida]MBA1321225.1 hypothetical protein [Pseudomonas plecoglossicida]